MKPFSLLEHFSFSVPSLLLLLPISLLPYPTLPSLHSLHSVRTDSHPIPASRSEHHFHNGTHVSDFIKKYTVLEYIVKG